MRSLLSALWGLVFFSTAALAQISGPMFPGPGGVSVVAANGYFGTLSWTGNSSPQSITGLGFQPDMCWIKDSSAAVNWGAFDSSRGATVAWPINSTSAQATDANSLTSFDADGISVGTTYSVSARVYVAYCWKNGNNQFYLDPKWTGTGSGSALRSHSLGVTPGYVISKDPAGAFDTGSWGLSGATTGYFISGGGANPGMFGNGASTSSTQYSSAIAAYANTGNATNIGYLFGTSSGNSQTGTYTGNGSTSGPTVSLGFQPRFIFIHTNASGGSWYVFDNKLNASSPWTTFLQLNSTAASSATLSITISGSGFQITTASATINTNAVVYFYMAFR
jgi:hypothetical protein